MSLINTCDKQLKGLFFSLKSCPCGKTPEELSISDTGQGGKWANVTGDCCGEWTIEFRTMYHALDSDECMKFAIEAWNEAPRGLEQQLSQANNRIKELEKRLEISPDHNIDGINARNETIRLMDIVLDEKRKTIQTLCETVLDAANDLFIYTNNPKTAEFLREKYRNLVTEIQEEK